MAHPIYFISQIEDITARKRAEEALQTNERELRELADSMPQLVWTTSADGRTIYFNQQWVDYTGLTWKRATAKAGSHLSTPTIGSARGMPGSVQYNIVTPIRSNAACGALMALSLVVDQRSAAAERERRDSQVVWYVHRHRTDQTHRARTQGCQRIP
jgi:PAS domain-containing protein